MIALALVVAAVVVTVLWILGYVPVLVALPAIGLVIAVLIGYRMRQNSGPTPPA